MIEPSNDPISVEAPELPEVPALLFIPERTLPNKVPIWLDGEEREVPPNEARTPDRPEFEPEVNALIRVEIVEEEPVELLKSEVSPENPPDPKLPNTELKRPEEIPLDPRLVPSPDTEPDANA